MASNPANGINNIALGGEQSEGITKKDLRELIEEVKSCHDSEKQAVCDRISDVADKVNDKRLRSRLNKLSSALMMAKSSEKLSDILVKMLPFDTTGEIGVLYQEALSRGN
jgi:flagellar motility protein MotE (MotC chaperone)